MKKKLAYWLYLKVSYKFFSYKIVEGALPMAYRTDMYFMFRGKKIFFLSFFDSEGGIHA